MEFRAMCAQFLRWMIPGLVVCLRRGLPVVLMGVILISGCRISQNPVPGLLSGLVPEPLPGIVKVGLVAPFEGTYRYIGYDAVYAARLAVREINAAGGLNGHRLELVAYDDRGDAVLAAQIAANLTIDPDVVAVIGHYRPETSASAGVVYADAELTNVVIGDAVAPAPASWHLSPSPEKVAAAMGEVGLASEPEMTAIWMDPQGDESLSDLLRAYLVDHALAPVAGDEPEVIFSLLGPVDTASGLADMRAAGQTGRIVGTHDLASAAFSSTSGDDIAGTQFVTPYPLPQDVPDTHAWIEAYRAMGPHVPNPGPYALPTYEAVYLVADALASLLEDGHSTLRSDLGPALETVARSGRLGELQWTADRHWASMPLYHYRWTQERLQLVRMLQ